MLKYQGDFINTFNKVVAEHPDCDYIEIVNTIIDPLKEILISAAPTPVVEQEDSSEEEEGGEEEQVPQPVKKPVKEPVKKPVKKPVKEPVKKESSGKNTFDSSKYESIKYLQENPKKKGTQSWDRYEKYKVATNYDEFVRLGGPKKDLKFDIEKGYLTLDGTEPIPKVNTPKTVKKKVEGNKIKSPKKPKKVKKEDVDVSDATSDASDSKLFDAANICDFDDVHKEDEDNSWPEKTIDGVLYKQNPSDNMLIDPNNGKQIGYLHSDDDIDDDNIEYIGDGEDLHKENIDKVE